MAFLRNTVPLVLFCVSAVFMYRGLFLHPDELTSALLNQPVPEFNVPNLLSPEDRVTNEDLKGRVVLLHVWAVWCPTCRAEYPGLRKIIEREKVPIYAIDYKDDVGEARNWIQQNGDFYHAIGSDTKGKVGIDLGIYGVPETFIIDKEGVIRYRFLGAIDEVSWQQEIEPVLDKLKKDE